MLVVARLWTFHGMTGPLDAQRLFEWHARTAALRLVRVSGACRRASCGSGSSGLTSPVPDVLWHRTSWNGWTFSHEASPSCSTSHRCFW